MKWNVFVMVAVATGFVVGGDPHLSASEKPLPKHVDLRPRFAKFRLVPRAQGARDTCSLFAVTGCAEYELARHASGSSPRLSEEYLVWAANDATGLVGDQAMFIEAVQGLMRRGICTETAMPYDARADAKRAPSDEARKDAHHHGHWSVHWIKRWNVNTGMTKPQLIAVKTELANDHPVAIGMRWPKALNLTAGHLLERPAPADVRDGHSVILVGYQDDLSQPDSGRFIIRNSDGPEWGLEGYAYFPYNYIENYGNDALALRHEEDLDESPRFRSVARFEAESLKIVKSSARCQPSVQDMREWGAGQWGGGKQLFCKADNGGSLELEFTLEQQGRFEIDLYLTLAPDYGRLKILLDGRVLTMQPDCFCGRVEPSGPLSLGTHDFKQGKHRLIVAVGGKNALSSGYSFGIDGCELFPRR